MALLNRPLTEGEAREMVKAWRHDWPRIPTFYDMLQEALREPVQHQIRYRVGEGISYTPPDHFYLGGGRKLGPSDCTLIIFVPRD